MSELWPGLLRQDGVCLAQCDAPLHVGHRKCGCAQGTPPSCQSLVLVAEIRDCAAPPCFVHDHVVEGAVEDKAGWRGGRLRLDAALERAEDGHVAMLRVRRAVRRDEAQHDLKESTPHGGKGGLGGVNAGNVPEGNVAFMAVMVHPMA